MPSGIKTKKLSVLIQDSGLEPLADRLRIKPSTIRTTVALSNEAMEDLVSLRKDWNLTPKDIFDGIFDSDELADLVTVAAGQMEHHKQPRKNQVTIVISATSQTSLKHLAKELATPRDHIVIVSLRVMAGLLEKSRNDRITNHKKALNILKETEDFLNKKEGELSRLLGEDDPLEYRFRYLGTILMNLLFAVDSEIENGTPIEPHDFSQQG
ncbi:MAG: hypothetical protein IH971_02210 [Candidatus Marinimicrobia bacterium]|nr:hypothetical protein [Candidatus Neomarinimicrobiota bacterium]